MMDPVGLQHPREAREGTRVTARPEASIHHRVANVHEVVQLAKVERREEGCEHRRAREGDGSHPPQVHCTGVPGTD